jgi:hypothetical protein
MRRFFSIFIFYIILSLLFLRGAIFRRGVISGGDWGFPVTTSQMQRYAESGLYTWFEGTFFGIQQFFLNNLVFRSLIGLLARAGISGAIYIKLLLVAIFVFSAFSMFLLCSFLRCNKKISALGGLLYITLPFFFNYTALGWSLVLFSMGLLPLSSILFIRSVREKKAAYSILTGVLYFLAMAQSQSLVWYPLVFLSFPVFLINDRNELFAYIRSLFIVFLVFLGLNTFLWLPLFFGGSSGVLNSGLGLASNSLGTWARLNDINILRGWGSLFNYQYETSYPNTLIPLSFLLPFSAYLSFFFLKKRKIIYSLALLSFVPIMLFKLGPGFIVKLPFSDLIRDVARFSVISSFAYVVLAIIIIDALLKNRRKYLKIIGIVFSILLIISAYPFWAGELFGKPQYGYDVRLRTYRFPKENVVVENKIGGEPANVKVLYLPAGGKLHIIGDKDFYGDFSGIWDVFAGYSTKPGGIGISGRNMGSATNLMFELKKIGNQGSGKLEKLLSLFGTKYVVVRKNAQYLPGVSGRDVASSLAKMPNLNVVEEWDTISLLENKRFLPHFYLPHHIIYSPNEIDALPDIVGLPGYELRSAIYLENQIPNSKSQDTNKSQIPNNKQEIDRNISKRDREILVRVDEVIVVGKNKNRKILEQIVQNSTASLSTPYPKHEPGTIRWKLAWWKQKYNLWKLRKDKKKLFIKHLFYADKRINELEKFGISNRLALADYRQQMNKAWYILQAWKKENQKNFWESFWQFRTVLEKHQKKLDKIDDPPEWQEELSFFTRKISALRPKLDFSGLIYRVNIPKDGDYKILLKASDAGERKWMDLGMRHFARGKQELALPLNGISENLLNDDLEIRNYQGGSFYRLRLNYQIRGSGDLIVKESNGRVIVKKNLMPTNGKIKEVQLYFQSSPEATSAVVLFSDPDIKYQNLIVQRVLNPKLLLRMKVTRNRGSNSLPKIEFIKINPTKYRVKVEGAEEPYTLVFGESYHKGWKLYVKEIPNYKFQETNKSQITNNKQDINGNMQPVAAKYATSLRNRLAGVRDTSLSGDANGNISLRDEIGKLGMWVIGKVGRVASWVTGLFLKNKGYGKEVASYFDGEIKEGTHRAIFLEPATFETWGERPIADDRHYLVNGYANSWYITPEDVGGKENYELIVEFWPQRLFYIGLAISISTLIGSLGYLAISWLKSRKAARN